MSNLRVVCIVIAIIGLASAAFTYRTPKNFDIDVLMAMLVLAVNVVGSLALLFGAILEHVRLVLVAFIINLVLFIWSVIVTLIHYFNTGYTSLFFAILFGHVLHLIFTYLNYAYYNELHGSRDD